MHTKVSVSRSRTQTVFPNDLCADSRAEKPARGALFTAMQRQMGQDTILIVDAMNYIKGFRYQMYCAARELKLRVCTVSFTFFRCYVQTHHQAGVCGRDTRAVQRVERKEAGREGVCTRNVSPNLCHVPRSDTSQPADWTTYS